MKLTPWYPARIKPARVGVYETRIPADGPYQFFQHWDGEVWGGSAGTEHFAYMRRHEQMAVQNVKWRGLAEAPK